MESAVQCPKCESDNTSVQSKSKANWFTQLLPGLILTPLGIYLLWGAIKYWGQPGGGSQPLGLGIACLVGGLGMLFTYFRGRKITVFKNRCQDCGHKWEQEQGQGSA